MIPLLHTTLETCGSISIEASFSSSLNCLVYGFKSIPCFSFGSRDGDSIAYSGLCGYTHSSSFSNGGLLDAVDLAGRPMAVVLE